MQAILDVSVCHRRPLCWLKETRRRFWKSGETEERLKRGRSAFRTEEATRSSFPLFRFGRFLRNAGVTEERLTSGGRCFEAPVLGINVSQSPSSPEVVALQQVHGEALLPSAGGGLVTSSVERDKKFGGGGLGRECSESNGMDVLVQAYHSYLLVVKRWLFLSRRKSSSHRGEMGNEQQPGSVGSNQVILSDTRLVRLS
ncbi:hypothetical protein YC2023_039619 [Brassica napus]